MLQIDPDSGVPRYAQIIDYFKTQIMQGKMHADQQIPSVRKMAKQLGINPNTVQKAYHFLKAEGVLYSVSGVGDFVCAGAADLKAMRKEQIIAKFESAVREARSNGMWFDEIMAIVDEAFSNP